MECVEYVPIDGSVVCTFRTIPPADMNSGNIHHDCLYSQAMGGRSYCISTEVYRANFNDVPVPPGVVVPPGGGGGGVVANTDPMPPPPTDSMPPVQGGGVTTDPGSPAMGGGTGTGECPTTPQVTGMDCAQYVPAGATEASCMYNGNLQCDCALQDSIATTEGWNCRTITTEGSNGGVAVTPLPAPVQPPITTIVNADISNVVVPVPTVTSITSGTFLPNLINPGNCPNTKPDDGIGCEWGQRCQYYVRDLVGNPTAALNCDCNGSCVFQCRLSQDPLFGQQSF